MWLLVPILLTVHILVCLLLVLVVLMQLPRSEGLGAAFGGGVTENIFGAQTTHVLSKFTVWLGIAFFVLTLSLAVAYSHQNKGSAVQRDLQASPAVAVPSASPAAPVVPAGLPPAEATPAATVPAVATPVVPVPAAPVPAPTAPVPAATP